ncbi:DNA polymerase-1 [Desulfitispora alkaliphila]
MKKMIVIDGNSLIHRAFHALPLMNNSAGVFTNAAFGFTRILLKIIKDEKPDYMAVAFDKGKVTFRHDTYSDYKGTRKATPDELRPQFDIVRELVKAFSIPAYELENYEADDLIGTLVRKAEAEGIASTIVTGDRDALQLVSDATKVMLTKKGITETEIYDLKKVEEKYNLTPDQLIELKGLMGDSSDNIPGVPGVGEKTGLKLLHQYGSISEVYHNIDQLKGKLKERLEQNRDKADISRELATINCQAPIDIENVEFSKENWNIEALLDLFNKYEFKTLISELPVADVEKLTEEKLDLSGNIVRVESENINELIKACNDADKVALLIVADGNIACYAEDTVYIVTDLENPELEQAVKDICEDATIPKVVHYYKGTFVALKKREIGLKGVVGDTMIGAHLLNPTQDYEDFSGVVSDQLEQNWQMPEDEQKGITEQVQLIATAAEVIHQKLEDLNLFSLYIDVELPLAAILGEMELTGVKVDKRELEKMGEELKGNIERLEQEIWDLTGEKFNINSPKQLGVILFENLKLPVIKKTKTGYSTNAEVLEALKNEHPIVLKIIDYRQLVKLKSTYVEGLKKLISKDTGRIHTTFNQTITATGRLSSTEPNLQNIPIRLEQGRKIRKAFITSKEDKVLLAADYSQIELRILAHISEDEKLITAFNENKDIHAKTAAEVFGVEEDEVTDEMRRSAKAVNFGIVYGISDYGLSRDLGIPRKKSKEYITQYLANYPGVKRYLEDIVHIAREQGYVTTLLNRRRYLPDLRSSNRNVRNFGERTALNTPIQGTAADIIKLAMIKVPSALKEKKVNAVMVLQVHDELIFEVDKEQLEVAAETVKECMSSAMELKVPLKVDVKWGYNWYEMHNLNEK